MRSTAYVRASLLFLLILFSVTDKMGAQMTTGTVSGTVRDQSGAVMPGASVSATNVETGIVRTTVVGSNGGYRIPGLAIGTYELKSELTGFQSSIRMGITLSVGQEAVVDFSMKVGNVAEQVTVAGDAPLLETTTAVVSGLVDPNQMREIPLNARSFINLVPLQAGAVFEDNGNRAANQGYGQKLSISGNRYETNSFLLDGADMNDSTGTAGSAAGTLAGVETVQEFRILTNAYDAEYGHHTGGVIEAVTKSGTNQFHGSAFEFLRNNDLDARNFFDRGSGPPPFRRSQFGGSFGGPIAKDRTFFFASYEGLRQSLGITQSFNVPGVAMRGGCLPNPTGCVTVNSAVKPYLLAFPLPNTPDRADGTAAFVIANSQTTNEDFGTVRVDHRFSDSDSLFGRFTIDDSEQLIPALNTLGVATTPNRFTTLSEQHLYSPQILGRTLFSYNRTFVSAADSALAGFQYPKFSFGSASDVPGEFSVPGLTAWGGSSLNPKVEIQNGFQIQEDIFVTHGKHSFKFGGGDERFQYNLRSDFYAGGNFAFSSLSDFLLGNSSTASFIHPGSDDIRGWRQHLVGLYVQDDISVRPGLTVNLGVRYEFINTPTEVNGKVATIRDITPAHLYSVAPNQTDLGNPYFLNPSLKNFAPRAGIGWSPFGNGKTVIRAGAGVFYQQILPAYYSVTGDRVPPFFAVSQLVSRTVPIDFPNAYITQNSNLALNLGSAPQIYGIA
jgi:hypothetical protein